MKTQWYRLTEISATTTDIGSEFKNRSTSFLYMKEGRACSHIQFSKLLVFWYTNFTRAGLSYWVTRSILKIYEVYCLSLLSLLLLLQKLFYKNSTFHFHGYQKVLRRDQWDLEETSRAPRVLVGTLTLGRESTTYSVRVRKTWSLSCLFFFQCHPGPWQQSSSLSCSSSLSYQYASAWNAAARRKAKTAKEREASWKVRSTSKNRFLTIFF